jgi:HEPN pEK499 p136
MIKTDFSAEIPLRAYVNAIIIDRAVETDAFEKCVRGALVELGYARDYPYQFKNPAYIVSFLYCLIVVSKEIWLTSKDDQIYKKIEEKKLVDLFVVKVRDQSLDDHPSYELIRHLRNAVAHARFSVDQSQSFVFWDHPNKKPRSWEAYISNKNLFIFLSEIARLVGPLAFDANRCVTTLASPFTVAADPDS